MPTSHSAPSGLWLPLVTPFRDGIVDEVSVCRVMRHYAGEPIDGLILAATTGERLTLDEEETERLVTLVATELGATGRSLRFCCKRSIKTTMTLAGDVFRR